MLRCVQFMLLGVKPVLLFQNRDCAQLGPPPQGEVVQVRWTDGLVYGAKFVAAHAVHMYLVGLWYLSEESFNLQP